MRVRTVFLHALTEEIDGFRAYTELHRSVPSHVWGLSMRRRLAVVLSLLLTAITATTLADDTGPRKVALLVGVNQYLKPGFKDLEFAEADVTAVAEELQKFGFKVTVLLGSGKGGRQATRANIESTAEQIVKPLGKNDIALVMLSGHGQQLLADPRELDFSKSKSYYCPVDARFNDPDSQVSLSHLVDDILALDVGTKLLLVDACRDIAADQSRGGRNAKGIEGRRIDLPEQTGVFFSCSAGQMSFERPELEHGLFTFCLLDGLRGKAARDGEIAWADLVAHVNRRMVQDDLTKLLPESVRQVPIPAGAVPHTVLGHVSARVSPTTPTPVPPPVPSSSETQARPFVNSVGQTMRPIPAGPFQMGSPSSDPAYRSDELAHTVRISRSFYLSAHEVTRGQFRQFVESQRYRTDAERDGKGGWGFDPVQGTVGVTGRQYTWLNPGYTQTDDHPVVNVSYQDAVAFTRWLSSKEDRVYRLPTEAEWEYACRAGSRTRYATGDSDSNVQTLGNVADRSLASKSRLAARWAQNWDDHYAFTAPVGSFQPNAWGIYDMHGNVWEWVRDYYDATYYRSSPAADPPGPASGEYRMFRGGGWFNPPPICRSANRNVLTPADRTNLIGFRVLMEGSP